jgi:hypothetical protein
MGPDRCDPGVRVGASHNRHVDHVGQVDVVDISRLPAHHPTVLAPAQRLSDGAHPR